MESHPLRMRGLKLAGKFNSALEALVASFTDAWIETVGHVLYVFHRVMSHPLRMRGLKLFLLFLCIGCVGRILYGCVD